MAQDPSIGHSQAAAGDTAGRTATAGDATTINPDAQRMLLARARPDAANVAQIALPATTMLHEYVIEGVLGSGSFGITYLARDTNLLSQVAIKEYLPSDLAIRAQDGCVVPRTESDAEGYRLGRERFLAETRVLATFRHPNIVRVLRFFEANGTAYMVMDYERGESLRDWAASHGQVTEEELLRMFLPLLEGLEIVHDSGVTHRDIKPANIYVRESDGSLVLLDFGAARNARSGRSRTMTTMVTPGYAPLEQYHSRGRLGPWSDIYALGGVLYWLVTGDKPVEAPSRVKVDTMPTAVEAGSGRYGRAFLAAIDWALATDDEHRPHDVREFRTALTGAAPARRPSDQPPARKRRSTLVLAGGLAIVVAVAAIAAYLLSPDKAPVAPVPEPPLAVATPPGTAAMPPPVAETPPAASSANPKATRPRAPAPAAAPVATETEQPAAAPMATLLFEIRPENASAEVRVDGIRLGVVPPHREFKVTPGRHRVEVLRLHWFGSYYTSIDVRANEKKTVWVTFPNT